MPDHDDTVRVFEEEAWPALVGQPTSSLVHRVTRPRGGNQRAFSLPFYEAIQVALWDLAAKQAGLPLHRFLGSRRGRVRAYASGLDYHLNDADFEAFFQRADAQGFEAFKIKVGHPDFDRDLSRLKLLNKAVRPNAILMIDANEAWRPKEALVKLNAIKDAGFTLLWVEDPILRSDFEGLRMLRNAAPWTLVNSGEYLDAVGKQALLLAGAVDILNVHGQITDVMRSAGSPPNWAFRSRSATPSSRSASTPPAPCRKWNGSSIRSRTTGTSSSSRWKSATVGSMRRTAPDMGWSFPKKRAATGPARRSWRLRQVPPRSPTIPRPKAGHQSRLDPD